LIDATPDATTPLEEQLNLLKEIKHTIPGKPLLVVHTKIDLFDVIPDDFEYYISAENGEGVEELRKVMIDQIAADYVIDPLVLPDHWHREEDSIKPLGTTQEVLRRYDEGKFL
jgi:GTP1/Obg family GTP-binding protein